SVPYYLINGGVGNGRVDKVISEVEDVFFLENDYATDAVLQEKSSALESLKESKTNKQKEIDGLEEKYDRAGEERAERYRNFVVGASGTRGLVGLLEDDLDNTKTSHVGLNILQRSVDITQKYAR